mgnify:CR=1 FL=1
MRRRVPSGPSCSWPALLEVGELHQGGGDPAAERAEVVVEQRAGAVGQCALGQLVKALVRHLGGVLGGVALLAERGLQRDADAFEAEVQANRQQPRGL